MDNKSWFLVIALGFLWGSSFLFVEILLDYMNPFLIVYLRVAIASIILIFYLFFIKIDIQFSNTLIKFIARMVTQVENYKNDYLKSTFKRFE